MQIKNYLIFSFATIMMAAIIMSTIIFYTATSLRTQNERVQFAQRQLMVLKEINNTLNRMLKEVSDFLLIGDEEEFEEYQESKAKLTAMIKEYVKITESEIEFVDEDEKDEEAGERETAEDIRRQLAIILSTAENTLQLAQSGDKKAALDQLQNSLESIYDENFDETLEDQIEDEENEIHLVNKKLAALTYRMQYITIITMVLMIATIGIVARLVLREIYKPVAALVPAIKEIGKGNFDVEVPIGTKNEIGALANSLKKMVDELSRIHSQLVQSAKLASIGQLAAGVAHELNQPLMVIRMNAQMVSKQLKQSNSNPQLEESIDLVERNTTRMKYIINHLRTFSRQTNGHRESVDINQIITDSFTMVNEQLKIHGIEVKKNLTPDLPMIKGCPNELEQVFVNLISNSKDALPDDLTDRQKQIEITTKYHENQQCIEATVCDTGHGIMTTESEKVFDPFFTTKPVGEGTGLGLSISYGIIKDHKGDIKLVDTSSSGTTFSVQLPVAEV